MKTISGEQLLREFRKRPKLECQIVHLLLPDENARKWLRDGLGEFHTHHIAGRHTDEKHFWCNLIRLSDRCHDFCHAHKAHGQLACWKAQLDLHKSTVESFAAAGMRPQPPGPYSMWNPEVVSRIIGRGGGFKGHVQNILDREDIKGTVFELYGLQLLAELEL